MTKFSEHIDAFNFFHDVNSVLYTATNIYLKPGILLNAVDISHSGNLALPTLTSIHSIRESTKIETPWKVTDGRFKVRKAQTGQKTQKSNWYIKKFEGKENWSCSIEEIDWYIMWK